MDIQVEDVGTPTSDPQSPQGHARAGEIAHLALGNRFGIVNANSDEDGKLAEIWAYARSMAQSDNIPDIMWEVVHLEGVLGAPKLGQTRLDKLYRYTKLKRQEAALQAELRDVSTPTHLHG